jgi:hypothetical protein
MQDCCVEDREKHVPIYICIIYIMQAVITPKAWIKQGRAWIKQGRACTYIYNASGNNAQSMD